MFWGACPQTPLKARAFGLRNDPLTFHFPTPAQNLFETPACMLAIGFHSDDQSLLIMHCCSAREKMEPKFHFPWKKANKVCGRSWKAWMPLSMMNYILSFSLLILKHQTQGTFHKSHCLLFTILFLSRNAFLKRKPGGQSKMAASSFHTQIIATDGFPWIKGAESKKSFLQNLKSYGLCLDIKALGSCFDGTFSNLRKQMHIIYTT